MARWKRKAEIYLFCSVWPVFGGCFIYGLWRLLLWSYGGREEFRRQIIREPLEGEWFLSNPKHVFFREAPLANVPEKIDPESVTTHTHHKNF